MRLGRQIEIDAAGEGKRHDERRRHQEVRLDVLMDARLEIAIARKGPTRRPDRIH